MFFFIKYDKSGIEKQFDTNDFVNFSERLENNSSTFLTKSEFNSFKDSISCYEDACKRIKDLEDTIESLKKRIDNLEGQDSSGAE